MTDRVKIMEMLQDLPPKSHRAAILRDRLADLTTAELAADNDNHGFTKIGSVTDHVLADARKKMGKRMQRAERKAKVKYAIVLSICVVSAFAAGALFPWIIERIGL